MAKLESIIFYIFIFAIPFQTRIILKSWGSSFNEWNSAFLYGTDLLLMVLFLLWTSRAVIAQRRCWYTQLFQNLVNMTKFSKLQKELGMFLKGSRDTFLFIFLGIAALSITQAPNKLLGFYSWLKLLEFVSLYFYVKNNAGLIFSLANLVRIAIFSGFIQSVTAVLQIIWQRNLGLKLFGESILRSNFSGIAVVPTAGDLPGQAEKFLRAYGTLPHPNVLAIFLIWTIVLALLFYLSLSRAQLQRRNVAFWVFYPLSLFALLASFSRTVLGVSFLAALVSGVILKVTSRFNQFSFHLKEKLIKLVVTSGLVLAFFVFLFTPQTISRLKISTNDQALSVRSFYNSVGTKLAAQKPWLGVGMGNFVPWFQKNNPNLSSWAYQPIHNIYLLIASEIGLAGLALFVIFIFLLLKQHPYFFQIVVALIFLAVGLFDHFFWTLQQGQLIFWLTLGLAADSKNNNKRI